MTQAQNRSNELSYAGLFTAAVFLATYVPHIPIPLGYIHLGNVVIFFIARIVSFRVACSAACLGSALADFFSGFAIWIVPTLIIKAVMAFVASRPDKNAKKITLLGAFLIASLWMAFAYAASGALLYGDFAAGLASLPGLLVEGLIASALGYLLLPAVKRAAQLMQ